MLRTGYFLTNVFCLILLVLLPSTANTPFTCFFIGLYLLSTFSFYLVQGSEPGYLDYENCRSLDSYMENEETCEDLTSITNHATLQYKGSFEYKKIGSVEFSQMSTCKVCKLNCPIRSNHCKYCKKCVATFDHHCFVIGTCIGERNHCSMTDINLTRSISHSSNS